MVELDVHLSKDRVPVIYHDFSIGISIKKKITPSDTDLTSDVVRVTYAVKDLTLDELQMLKLSPVNNRKLCAFALISRCLKHSPWPRE